MRDYKLGIKNTGSIVLLSLSCLMLIFSGCARMREGVRAIAGISTREVENSRQNSIKQVFECDYFTCYAKVQDALKHIGAYVFAENKEKDLIAIYVSQQDTTPVGLFFREIDSTHTQIEISSPSSFARDTMAEKIFANLAASFYQDEKKQ